MGKSNSIVTGYHYRPAMHWGLGRGPFDAYLAWTVADKFAFKGELTASGTVTVSKPNLFGGQKDQGGVEGTLEIMFGEADQMPNSYLASTFGPQQPAWRGLTTAVWRGGRYGANNPYAQKNASKIRKILKGWDNDDPWYPETAEVPVSPDLVYTLRFTESFAAGQGAWYVFEGDPSNFAIESHDGRSTMRVGTDSNARIARDIAPVNIVKLSVKVKLLVDSSNDWAVINLNDYTIAGIAFGRLGVDTDILFFWTGFSYVLEGPPLVVGHWYFAEMWYDPSDGTGHVSVRDETAGSLWAEASAPAGASIGEVDRIMLRNDDAESEAAWTDINLYSLDASLIAMNAAHMLVYMRTDSERGREPLANVNSTSLTDAADKLYEEGFGLCTEYDPASESPVEFEQRICRVIGGSFERSITDGQWYLDLARGDYDIEDLPILTDADILDFREQPTTLDRAVNSMSVKYFDPELKESIVTPAVRALGLVRRFGEIHETLDFPEIPTSSLALRVAKRELLSRVTPTRGFKLVTTPRTYAWRPNQYFRLQSLKRGIVDMVCIVGQKTRGTLKSGAIDMIATQDIYGLPDTSYVEVETGVDPDPSQEPGVVETQRADEVPYFELASKMPRAELAAMPEDAGYIMAAASEPDAGRDFTMMAAPAGVELEEVSTGFWCPTATTLAAAGIDTTVIPLDEIYQLEQVEIGAPALWDDEIVRVDAKDLDAGTVTLGRGCADTVPPIEHAAGSRIWFYDLHVASDATEYADGETVAVRLLSNTGSERLDLVAAPEMEVTLDQRAFRPYPPARLRVNGVSIPVAEAGSLTVAWAHRDRILQADQLVDTEDATIGPEAGTTYTLRLYVDNDLKTTVSGVSGASSAISSPVNGDARLEVESLRDGLTSWQKQVREFVYTGAVVPTTWSTTDKGTDLTLIDADLSIYRSANTGTAYDSGRAAHPLKEDCYWEVTCAPGATGILAYLGIATATMPVNHATWFTGNSAGDCGCGIPNNTVFQNNVSTDYTNSGVTASVWKFAWKHATRELWVGTVALGWFGGGDPAAGTLPTKTLPAGTYYPAVSYTGTATGSSRKATGNFGASAFSGAVPTGYVGGVFI